MAQLKELYKEHTKQTILKQSSVLWLQKKIAEATIFEYDKEYFLEDLKQTIEGIKTSNEVLEDIKKEIEKKLAKKEF